MQQWMSDGHDQGDEGVPTLPVHGGSGVVPDVDLTSNAALRDLMDSDEPLDALR